MRTLICGASGLIGSALARALVASGQDIYGTQNSHDAPPCVKRIEADLTCRAGWDSAVRVSPELVYMCAGKTGGSGLDPLHFVTDNVLMAAHMYRACAEAGVKRIVYLSSTTGYPDSADPMRERDYFYGELHPAYFNPGHTKRFIERLGAMWAHKVETVFVRVGGVYGPGGDFDPVSSHVIEATIRKVAERHDPLVMWGDGLNVRDAVYIDDLVAALIACADWPAGAYNLATGEPMSVNDILHTLLAHADHQPRIERDLSKPEMLRARLLNCDKAHAMGWRAKVPMREGIIRTYDWYKAQQC